MLDNQLVVFIRHQHIANVHHLVLLAIDELLYCVVGNSANQAIDLLIRKGVPEDRIIFLNLISVYIYLSLHKELFYYLMPVSSSCVTPAAHIFLDAGS